MTSSGPAKTAPSAVVVSLLMAFNFFSSVFIITVNKTVFRNYGWNFSILLTSIHMFVTFAGLLVCNAFGMFTVKLVPCSKVIPLSLTFIGFVVFNNYSLLLNSVGFYQLMKVLTTPFIAVVQYLMFNVQMHWKLQAALIPICVGVAMATVSDVEVSFWGTFYAVLGIISTSFYQIYVKSKQQDLQLDSYQLLFLQSPVSAVLVLFLSFCFEPIHGEHGWLTFNYDKYTVLWIAASCLLAFCVNLSIFMVIGKTSPIAYNVLGHFKLCVILISGFVLFHEDANIMKLSGTFLAFLGVVLYTHFQQSTSSGWDQRKGNAAAAVPPPMEEATKVVIVEEKGAQALAEEANLLDEEEGVEMTGRNNNAR